MKKSIALFMALLSVLLPIRLEPYANAGVFAEASSQNGSEPTVVQEAEWLRETNSETYILSDGSYECVVYSEDKYYRDAEGSLRTIDNSIIESPLVLEGSEYKYRNKANGYTVRFFDEQPKVLISAKGHEISFELSGSLSTGCTVGGCKSIDRIAGYVLSGDNCVAYNGVLDNTDIVYAASVDSVKEYIVLTGSGAPNEFVFTYDLHGGSIAQTEEGVYAVYAADGERVFDFGTLFAVDAAENYSDALTYDFAANGDKTSVTVTLDPDYLNDPERVYPVVIDPSISIYGANNTKDSFVSSKHPTLNYYMNTQLMTGRDVSYYVRRTYIGFTLPSSITGNYVSSAYIKLKKNTGATPSVRAYRVTGSWTSSTITWNNKPGVDSSYTSGYATLISNNWYYLYVTSVVRNWVNGTNPNYGFMLRDDTESGDFQWTTFYSSDAASPNKPELHITYYYYGPRGYDEITTTANCNMMNCMGYAFRVPEKIGLPQLGIDLEYMSNMGMDIDDMLDYVDGLVQTWIWNNNNNRTLEFEHPITYQTINSYNSTIPNGYYRAVLRVGYKDNNGDGVYNYDHNASGNDNDYFDFHWWYQTLNGDWADKPGTNVSRIFNNTAGTDPTSNDWSSSVQDFYYTSAGKYYAIQYVEYPDWPEE